MLERSGGFRCAVVYPVARPLTHSPLMTPPIEPQTPAERFAHEEKVRAEKRRRDIAEQRSDENSPAVRIRVWEKLHSLRLPIDPAHPVLDVIAVNTRLTLEQVLQEQCARAERAANKTSI
jgi:hypothetical protein